MSVWHDEVEGKQKCKLTQLKHSLNISIIMLRIIYLIIALTCILTSSCDSNEKADNVHFNLNITPLENKDSLSEVCITVTTTSVDTIVWILPHWKEVSVHGLEQNIIDGSEIPLDWLIDPTITPAMPPDDYELIQAREGIRMYNCFERELEDLNPQVTDESIFHMIRKKWIPVPEDCCGYFLSGFEVIGPNESKCLGLGYISTGKSGAFKSDVYATYTPYEKHFTFKDTFMFDNETIVVTLPTNLRMAECYGFETITTPDTVFLRSD